MSDSKHTPCDHGPSATCDTNCMRDAYSVDGCITKGTVGDLRFTVDEDASGFTRVWLHDDKEGITQTFDGYEWSSRALNSALMQHRRLRLDCANKPLTPAEAKENP